MSFHDEMAMRGQVNDPKFMADADRKNRALDPLPESASQERGERIRKTEPALIQRAKEVSQNS
jgi:hypothetical protein